MPENCFKIGVKTSDSILMFPNLYAKISPVVHNNVSSNYMKHNRVVIKINCQMFMSHNKML